MPLNEPRIVFFGMSGLFSALPLDLLLKSELRPVLIVEGFERARGAPRGSTFVYGRRRWPWTRIQPGTPTATPTSTSTSTAASTASTASATMTTTTPNASPRRLQDMAELEGIDFIRTNDVDSPRVRARIRAAKPDAYLVAGFPQLLPREMLAFARLGGLNIHPGALPNERGPAPLFWAFKDGRTSFTYSIHMLEEGEDTGDVVASGEVSFVPGCDLGQVIESMARAAAFPALRCLRGLIDGDIVRTPQRPALRGRRPRPTFRDGLVDSTRPARAVFVFVRGCASVYSLFVESGGDRFFVRNAVSYDDQAELPFAYVLMGNRLHLRCQPGEVVLDLKEDGALFGSEYDG